jgi:predicted HD phosphohydrolase
MQVFYIPDKRHIVGVDNVVDEDDYNYFDEISPFSSSVQHVQVNDNEERNYMRSYHEEGI